MSAWADNEGYIHIGKCPSANQCPKCGRRVKADVHEFGERIFRIYRCQCGYT